MDKTDKIDYAILKTLEVHPDFTEKINLIIFENCSKINNRNFTLQGNARSIIEADIKPDDFIAFVANQLINIYITGLNIYHNYIPEIEHKDELFDKLYGDIYWKADDLLQSISKDNINIILYFKSNPQKLLEASTIVASARYSNIKIGTHNLRPLIDKSDKINWRIHGTTAHNLREKIFDDLTRQKDVENINVRRTTVNKCLKDIINGTQLTNYHNEYQLDGTLFATQDVGKYRNNQEDAVLIMTHPKNPEFKILVVSDGMGGVNYGEYASSETVREMAEWFDKLDPELFYYPDTLQKMFNQKIQEISNHIYNAKNTNSRHLVAGATFVGAIVTENKTIISFVGDSRAYIIKKGNLKLVTRDEAPAWIDEFGNNRPTSKELDEYRFAEGTNVIYKNIGEENIGRIQSSILENNSYDRLFLFSDGVTDLLPQDRIALLGSHGNLEQITKLIVAEALKYDAVKMTNEGAHVIKAGKDNTTAAMYARR